MTKRETRYHLRNKTLTVAFKNGIFECKEGGRADNLLSNYGSTKKEIPVFSFEDLRETIEEFKKANLERGSHIEVTEYDELHYQLSGSAYGIVRKDRWNELLLKEANK